MTHLKVYVRNFANSGEIRQMEHQEACLAVGIGNTLKRLRIERKLTQKELAAKVSGGLDYTYIGKIEREEQLPSLKILIKLAKALNVPLSSFFQAEDDQQAGYFRSDKVVNLASARKMSSLQKELNMLHSDDIPLLVEIVRALNRHRQSGITESKSLSEYPLVAEELTDYEGDD